MPRVRQRQAAQLQRHRDGQAARHRQARLTCDIHAAGFRHMGSKSQYACSESSKPSDIDLHGRSIKPTAMQTVVHASTWLQHRSVQY